MHTLLNVLRLVLVPYVVSYYALNMVMLLVGALELRRQRRVPPALTCDAAIASGLLDPVSILVPAFNEALTIARTLASLGALRYPEFEIVVVSDGSTDTTMDVLNDAYALRPVGDGSSHDLLTQRVRNVYESRRDPRIRVVDKRNGGKADALNAGLNYARYPLVLVVDADVVLDRDALLHLAVPFACDAATVATSGTIRPQNGCWIENGQVAGRAMPSSLTEGFQVLEYLRAYGVGRLFFNRRNAHVIISGAFGLFSRRVLIDAGGYQPHAIGEDIELVVRLHRDLRPREVRYAMAFAADALCLTEAPHSLGELGRQRTRWHQGLLSTLRLHRAMIGRRRYGAVGTMALPYFLMELIFPVVDTLVWVTALLLVAAGVLPAAAAARFLAVTILAGTAVSITAVAIDVLSFSFFERAIDYARLVLLALIEPLGYRQCTVFFRLRTFVRYYRGLHLSCAWRSPARMAPADHPLPQDRW